MNEIIYTEETIGMINDILMHVKSMARSLPGTTIVQQHVSDNIVTKADAIEQLLKKGVINARAK